jgi:hypothetical protein
MMQYLSDMLPTIIFVVVAIVAMIVIIACIPTPTQQQQQKLNSKPIKALECFGCGTDRMIENYGCVKCERSWCKICIDHCLDTGKADWVLADGLSDMCARCRPEREMSLPKPVCFNCENSIHEKTLQCKNCHRTYCTYCKYESLNATNNGCIMCTPQDENWKRKSSAKAICMSCDRSYDKLYQCGKCMRTYCKYCNYKINNDTCWDCVIVI